MEPIDASDVGFLNTADRFVLHYHDDDDPKSPITEVHWYADDGTPMETRAGMDPDKPDILYTLSQPEQGPMLIALYGRPLGSDEPASRHVIELRDDE